MPIDENLLKKFKCMLSAVNDDHIVDEPILLPCGLNACKQCLKNGGKCLNCNKNHKETGKEEVNKDIIDTMNEHLNDLMIDVDEKLLKASNDDSNFEDEIESSLKKVENGIEDRIEALKRELEIHKTDFLDRIRGRITTIRKHQKSRINMIKETFEEGTKTGNADEDLKLFYVQQNALRSLNENLKSFRKNLHEVSFIPSTSSLNLASVGEIKGQDVWTRTLTGHNGCVSCVLKMTNGDLVSGSYDKTIKIWDLETGQCKSTLTGHSDDVCGILEMRTGDLVSRSRDNTIKIWDIEKLECKRTLTGHTGYISCILELKTGALVSGGSDETIKIWDIEKGECKKTIPVQIYFSCILEMKTGELVIGCLDGTIQIWDIKTGQPERTLTGHSDEVCCILELKNGNLASGSKDNTIKIWDIITHECKNTLSGHNGSVSCILEMETSELVSGSEDCTIKIWDLEKGECKKTSTGHTDKVCCILEIENGDLVSGSNDNTIKIWI